MVGGYKKNKSVWIELMDKFTASIAIIVVETDEKEMTQNIRYDYLNHAYGELHEIKREDLIGKGVNEIEKNIDKKCLYAVWDAACNGVAREVEVYDEHCNKYIQCKYFQIEYGVCGCIYEDNTINHKMLEMLQDVNKH